VYRNPRDGDEAQQELEKPERLNQTLKLTDQYLALLLLVLTNAGLCDVSQWVYNTSSLMHKSSKAITSMIEETTTGSNLSRKATLLLAEALAMTNRVLPLSIAGRIQVCKECRFLRRIRV
jgi:rapamycin-insensitive companion of mTOR